MDYPTESEKIWNMHPPKPLHYDADNYYVETDNTSGMEIELTPVQVNRIFKGVDAAALLDQGAILKIKGKTYERAFGKKNES